jgi:uncharacterized integral membrane protein
MARLRRGPGEDSAAVPGQRPEAALPPDADRDQVARAAAESTGSIPTTPNAPTTARTPVPPAPGAPTPPDAQATPGGAAAATGDTAAPAGTPATPTPPATPTQPTAPPQHHKLHHTRLSGTWVAIICFALVLVFLLIFILQNSHTVDVSYFGAHGHLPLGVALLLAAVSGILLVALAGSARIMQLRATARKHRRADMKAAKTER